MLQQQPAQVAQAVRGQLVDAARAPARVQVLRLVAEARAREEAQLGELVGPLLIRDDERGDRLQSRMRRGPKVEGRYPCATAL